MSVAKEKESDTAQTLVKDINFPIGDLFSDDPTLESELHIKQINLLFKCLKWHWRDRDDFYAAGNVTIYYSRNQPNMEDFQGPDFFVVVDTERKFRKRWIACREYGRYPDVIVEVISESTAHTDKVIKKRLYEDIFRANNYFWFDPQTLEFVGFYLARGKYEPLEPNEQGHLWSTHLQLYVGIHEGFLRYFTAEGKLVPTPEEQVDKLAAKLRELNIDPDSI